MAHTGGLFFVSAPLAVARGSGTEVGASEGIEKKRTKQPDFPLHQTKFKSTTTGMPVRISESADVIQYFRA